MPPTLLHGHVTLTNEHNNANAHQHAAAHAPGTHTQHTLRMSANPPPHYTATNNSPQTPAAVPGGNTDGGLASTPHKPTGVC